MIRIETEVTHLSYSVYSEEWNIIIIFFHC